MNRQHVKYLVVGGGGAAGAAVEAIRQRDAEGSVLLVGQEVNRPYRRPPLSKQYLMGRLPRADLFTLPDAWFAAHRVELRTGRRASQLDTTRRSVLLDSGDEIVFDKLLIATGGGPRHLQIPGADLPNVFYLRAVEDADRLRLAAEKARGEGRAHERGRGRVAIVGAGLLGVELASSFAQLGLHADLVVRGLHPWTKFADETVGRFMARYTESRGVRLHAQTTVLRLEGDGRVQRAMLSDGSSLDCDFVVPAIGIVPHTQLLRGTTLAAERAILVDAQCRSNDPDIYAAGDCAALLDPLFGKYRMMDHWNSSLLTGALAGRNMAGAGEQYSAVSRFDSEVFDLAISVWGEARLVERRIVRGSVSLDKPDFLELGVAADGRIAQVLAINHVGEDETLRELVRRRSNVDGNEAALRDPATPLAALLE